MSLQHTNGLTWRSHYYILEVEVARWGLWELTITSTRNDSCWEWTATFPNWEDETGKHYQGASFSGRKRTKKEAKMAAENKAAHTLLG